MEAGELLDVAWQLPDDAEGIVVVHRSDGGGLEAERYAVAADGGLEDVPDRVSRIIEEDGRQYGVWTRR